MVVKPSRGGELRLYLCSLPFRTSHTDAQHHLLVVLTHTHTHTHTVTHTACAPLREKHLFLLQCAEITVMRKKRVGEEEIHQRISHCTCCPTELSELRNFHRARTHAQTHKHTHKHTQTDTRDFRTASSLKLTAAK